MKIRLKPLLGGLATRIAPPVAATMGRRNQPRVNAAYYYTVWMRHVCSAAHFDCWSAPTTVLEIGPGTALGTGIAALLSGAQHYIAYDTSPILSPNFDEELWAGLLTLFRERRDFAEKDRIALSTAFPRHLFPDALMQQTLSADWLERVRSSIQQRSDLVRYLSDFASLPSSSVDYLFSHSVLEHVSDLATMYQAMWRCLRPGGVMTHSIDFSAHGTSPYWNGHWTVPDFVWHLMQGKRIYFINREPASTHRALLEQTGFEICGFHCATMASPLTRNDLAQRFRQLAESDFTTCSAFIVARKPFC